METETPRDADGNKLCAWCGGPIRQSGVGRSRDYCSRTHREYAYRKRRDLALLLKGYARGKTDAEAWTDSSTGGSSDNRRIFVSPVDETTTDPTPGEGWVRSSEEIEAQLAELEQRRGRA